MEQETRVIRKYRGNRFTFPKEFRDHFETENGFDAVITGGGDGCLELYSKDEFMKIVSKLDSYNNRILLRHFMASAEKLNPDSRWRVRIPENLLEYAGITDSCRFIRRKRPTGTWKYEIRA